MLRKMEGLREEEKDRIKIENGEEAMNTLGSLSLSSWKIFPGTG